MLSAEFLHHALKHSKVPGSVFVVEALCYDHVCSLLISKKCCCRLDVQLSGGLVAAALRRAYYRARQLLGVNTRATLHNCAALGERSIHGRSSIGHMVRCRH